MAWPFSLSAECGPTYQTAKAFAEHFSSLSWQPMNGRRTDLIANIFQGFLQPNWWCMVSCKDISEIGIISNEDAQQMTDLGSLLYQHLRSAPSFRYATVGVAVDEFMTYNELITNDGTEEHLAWYSGLVVSEDIWRNLGCPNTFSNFSNGYLWIPYRGETYSPPEANFVL